MTTLLTLLYLAGATPFPLWKPGVPVPTVAETPVLEGARFHVIKAWTPDRDGYRWLHGVALAWHKGALYASFGLNKGEENTASEEAACVRSLDDGASWGALSIIDPGEGGLAVSHGTLVSRDGVLWAFQGAFHGVREGVHMLAYRLDDATGAWSALGTVAERGFWPLAEPRRMADGNWLMAGIQVGGEFENPANPAAVAISQGEDWTKWRVIAIPKPPDMAIWGESAVIGNGPNLTNIARSRGGMHAAMASASSDSGATWSLMQSSNLPMAASKPHGGMLSTGQRYLIGSMGEDVGDRRSPLVIAVSEPGGACFTRMFVIRGAVHDGPGESGPNMALSYPCAVEKDGFLYVGYSNDGGRGANQNSAELAIIPVAALVVK